MRKLGDESKIVLNGIAHQAQKVPGKNVNQALGTTALWANPDPGAEQSPVVVAEWMGWRAPSAHTRNNIASAAPALYPSAAIGAANPFDFRRDGSVTTGNCAERRSGDSRSRARAEARGHGRGRKSEQEGAFHHGVP